MIYLQKYMIMLHRNKGDTQDLEKSVRFSYADWQSRPLSQKLMGYVLFPFRYYL